MHSIQTDFVTIKKRSNSNRIIKFSCSTITSYLITTSWFSYHRMRCRFCLVRFFLFPKICWLLQCYSCPIFALFGTWKLFGRKPNNFITTLATQYEQIWTIFSTTKIWRGSASQNIFLIQEYIYKLDMLHTGLFTPTFIHRISYFL